MTEFLQSFMIWQASDLLVADVYVAHLIGEGRTSKKGC
jgi:hypothetical protein